MDISVTFDQPTLSFTVTLVMMLSSLALFVHWIVNRTIVGLRLIALAVVCFSMGSYLIFGSADYHPLLYGPVAGILLLVSHMWMWAGLSDFWDMRHKQMVFTGRLFFLLAGVVIVYQVVSGVGFFALLATVSGFIAVISFGIVRTLIQALGGSLGLYKGIVRRTTVGVGLAVVLFVMHGGFALYNFFASGLVVPGGGGAGANMAQRLFMLGHFETLVFIIMFALVMIIMTAERLQAELRIQEMMDPLTRALNKRAFLEVMKAVLARARRLSDPVSLIMIDIDKFKKINLKHGRSVGDMALVEFAALVMEGRRSQDIFCRFGGEEFVLMLPGTPEEGADLVAARIKSAIENTSLNPSGVSVKLTVSMGVVTARGDDLDAEGMLDVVDRRMHNAQKLLFETIETA